MPVKIVYDGMKPGELGKRVATAFKTDMPRQIKVAGQQWFNKSFQNQGFTDQTLIPWKGTKSGKTNKFGEKSKGILIKSGRLRRSIKALMLSDRVRFVSDVPYADIHNEGFDGTETVKAHTRQLFIKTKVSGGFNGLGKKKRTQTLFLLGNSVQVKSHTRHMKMPRRKFMGESYQLNQIVKGIIIKTFSNATRN